MTSQIENIIFDIGRVIVGYEEAKVIASILPKSAHKEFYIEKFLKQPVWQDLDRGTINVDEAIEKLKKSAPYPYTLKDDVHKITNEFANHLPQLHGSEALFELLASKYPVYILSNFQDKPFDQLLLRLPFLKKARGMVVSAKVKMMKPEPEIYEYLLRTFNLQPDSCVFLDDRVENIESAKKLGLHGIVFQNADQAKKQLHELGVL